MVTFRDHFSRQSSLYATYRPSYPPELFQYVSSIAPGHHRAWDCATGNGQAAIPLAGHFAEVIATDASPQQIAHAEAAERVRYSVASAEASGIESGSVDLVTVAQALHWLDLEKFYPEATRALVDRGAIAVWGYGDPVIDDSALDAIVHRFNRGTLEEYWTPNRDLLLDGYRSLPFPFRELKPPAFRLERQWSLPELAGYLRTWSATNRYAERHGEDPVARVEAELKNGWGGDDARHLVTWPLYLRVGVNSD